MLLLLRLPAPVRAISRAAKCLSVGLSPADQPGFRAGLPGCPRLLSPGLESTRHLVSATSPPPGSAGDQSDPAAGEGEGYPGLSGRPWPAGLNGRSSLSPREIPRDLHDVRTSQGLGGHHQVPRGYSPETGAPSTQGPLEERGPATLTPAAKPQAKDMPFKQGDVVLAEFRKKRHLEFQKMFTLAGEGQLQSNWGMIPHREILGKLPGQMLRTSTGILFLLKRASLEEFVLRMRRGPAISYPKDANTMLMMMDVNHGDCVLESGSGSGAMTLFLSRAVGTSGRVHSFEIREDHHSKAQKNYRRWRKAWEVSHEEEWPNNVEFINKDIVSAIDELQGKLFDAVVLDMLSPQLALPVICSHLKQGHICAVYLANITQVIDLLEGVRSCQLPLVCERIIEVIQREWLVSPAKRKDGTNAPRVQPQKYHNVEFEEQREERDEATSEDEGDEADENKPFCAIPYIARPHHEQFAHTAFLVKLRKFKPAPPVLHPGQQY